MDRPPIRRTADLKGLRIAALRDSLGHIYASRQRWDATIVPVESRREAIQMLREGRCDAVLMMALVMNYFLRIEGTKDVVQAELPLDELNYRLHYGVKPKNGLLLRALNEVLLEARRNGAYDRLHQKWLGPLEARPLQWRDLRPTALLGAGLLGAALVAGGAQIWKNARAAGALEDASRAIAAEAMGGRDPGADPLAAMQSAVRDAQRRAEMLGVYRGNLSALDILTEISKNVPRDLEVVFEEFSIERDTVQIRGHTPDFKAVDRLVSEVKKFPAFSDVVIGGTDKDARRGGVNFDVRIRVAGGAS